MHLRIRALLAQCLFLCRAMGQHGLSFTARLVLITGVTTILLPPVRATQEQTPEQAATVNQAMAPELVKGQAVERELAGGEVHVYQINVAAGQFLHVVVDQRGIDVVVRVLDPAGKQVAEFDGPNGAQGPEPVYLVIQTQGSYRLEVRSLDKQAARGRYEVSVKAVRTATAKDTNLVAAHQVFVAGMLAFAQGSRESLLAARTKFEEALPAYRLAGNRAGEADALARIGDVAAELGENQRAVEYYNLALPLWKAVGDRKGEAVTLSNLALAHDSAGDKQKALDYYSQSLPPTREVGDRRGEGITLNNIGLVYNSLGENQKALDYFNLALPLRKTIGDRRGEAITLHNIGLVYESLGELPKALEYYDPALKLFKSLGNRRTEALTLNNIGKVYALMADHQKALAYFYEALPIHRAVGNRTGEASTLGNIGRIHFSLGNRQAAREYFNQAWPLWKATNDRRGEASTLTSMGDLYASSRENLKALEYYQQALPLWKAVGDRRGEADALYSIARVELNRGNLPLARDTIQSALPLIELIRTNVSSQDLRASYFATVQSSYELLIDILQHLHAIDPSGGHSAAALQVSERARARSLLDLLAEARADIRRGVDPVLVQRERTLQQNLNLKVDYQFRILSGKHTPEQAAATASEIDALTNDLRVVQAQLRATSPAYAALTQPQPLSVKQIQQLLDPETTLLEYSMGEERSYLWLVRQKEPPISFTLPKRSEIEATVQRLTRLLSEAGTPQEFESTAAVVSKLLLAPAAGYLHGKRLVIVADGALQYVPFAALPKPEGDNRSSGYVPLLSEYEIVSLPSASTLATLRASVSQRRPAAKGLAVFADPVFTPDDDRVTQTARRRKATTALLDEPARRRVQLENERAAEAAYSVGLKRAGIDLRRLPFSRYEAERLLALVPRRDALAALDFAASQTTAMSSDLGQYRIVHFATHGYLNPRRPDLSGLVLSLVDKHGAPQDGFLSLPEIYNLRLGADLVVLSACETGLGKQVRGEGLVGMTRGFMYAGAPRVVASLWAVEDRATAEMMGRFYTAMLKRRLRPSAALRQAQLSMWREARWSAPQQWAGFVFQGEWR